MLEHSLAGIVEPIVVVGMALALVEGMASALALVEDMALALVEGMASALALVEDMALALEWAFVAILI